MSFRARPVLHAALVVGFYLGLALWTLRVVLPAPATIVALPVDFIPEWQPLKGFDQKLRIAVIASHARAFVSAPSTLLDGPQCYPLKHAMMLGEHELGAGLLGVLPYALSGEPIFAYNAVAVLVLTLAGIAMYMLVYEWTGSVVAALVAGTLFAINPTRVRDLSHISSVSNHWTPLALLCMSRLFSRGSWTAALGVAMFVSLQTLESIYPLLALTVIAGTLGVWLAYRHRHDLLGLAPKLAMIALVATAVAGVVLGPYVDFRMVWSSLAGHEAMFEPAGNLLPGGQRYLGTVTLVFAIVGVLDRIRHGPQSGDDPRFALLVTGALLVWTAIPEIPLPGISTPVPSLFTLASSVVPGLDAIRRIAVIGWGLYVVAAVLAGYGVAAIARTRPAGVRAALAAVLVTAALFEHFVPSLARASFGYSLVMEPSVLRPASDVLDVYARMGPGAVLDVPYPRNSLAVFHMADYVLDGAFHRHPVATCYNSFRVPLDDDIARYAARALDDADAAEALAALGIRYLVVRDPVARHRRDLGLPAPAHMEEVGLASDRIVYRFRADPTVTTSLSALEARSTSQIIEAAPPAAYIDITFSDRTTVVFRHPDPIQPTPLVARWENAVSDSQSTERVTVLFPPVLVPGNEVTRQLSLSVPPVPGIYRVTLTPLAAPSHALVTFSVRVAEAARESSP